MKISEKGIARLLAVLLLVSCLLPLGALAATDAEQDAAFADALHELESYLENPGVPGRSLDTCIAVFSELGKHKNGDTFMRYATALQMIEAEDFTVKLDLNLKYISTPESAKIIEKTESEILCPPETLTVYKNAREAEAAGDAAEAMAQYEQCLWFYDSTERHSRLFESISKSAYEEGITLLESGDLAGAYYKLLECPGYEMSDVAQEWIVEELGYVPESPTDNPCVHEWQEATCTAPKTCALCGATEGEPLGHVWQEATRIAPETCSRCGETRGTAIKEFEAGDTVLFGSYEQDNDPENGTEPIEWLILEISEGKALLLSRYGLDAVLQKDSKWETCPARTWLNGVFYETAFTAEEQTAILTTTRLLNPKGVKLEDKLFLLNQGETVTAFQRKEERVCVATPYARAKGCVCDLPSQTTGKAACVWWIRDDDKNRIAAVGMEGNFLTEYAGDKLTVRPAMWVDMVTMETSRRQDAGEVNEAMFLNTPYSAAGYFTAGDFVTFGVDDTRSGKEPLEWRVLEVRDDAMLLLSRKSAGSKPYDETDNNTSWEACTLRQWLNGAFMENTFNESEREKIRVTEIPSDTEEAEHTEDRVFLLSKEEIETYLPKNIGDSYFTINNTRYWVRPEAGTEKSIWINGRSFWSAKSYESFNVLPAVWVAVDSRDCVRKVNAEETAGPRNAAEGPLGVGSTVTFGFYDQDGLSSNGKEPIEWKVLEIRDGRMLLLSRYALRFGQISDDLSWLKFTSEESRRVQGTLVDTGVSTDPSYSSMRVFLLSLSEIASYLPWNETQTCGLTPAAEWNANISVSVADGKRSCAWWLRTYKSDQYYYYVGENGGIDHRSDRAFALRPAIWVEMNP